MRYVPAAHDEFDGEAPSILPETVGPQARLRRPSLGFLAATAVLVATAIGALCVWQFDRTRLADPGSTISTAGARNRVECTFMMMDEDSNPGDGDLDHDGLEYGMCVKGDSVYNLLYNDAAHNLEPGKVIIDIEPTDPPSGSEEKWRWYKVINVVEGIVAAAPAALSTAKEVKVLTVICEYNDNKPDYIDEAKALLDLTGDASDFDEGEFPGSFADMLDHSSYGQFLLKKSGVTTVTVRMQEDWNSITGCPVGDIANRAIQKVRQQHRQVNPNDFSYHEFFIPRSPNGGCRWGGLASVGCGHPSRVPNSRPCNAWYRVGGPFVRAHELGHNLGLLHAGGESRGRFVEYGDPQASMGASYRFSSFTAAARAFMGFLSSDDVIEWTSGELGRTTPATISSISVPKGQQGADAVAIKVKCDRCVPKVSRHANNVGGYLWISFRGQEHYSPLDVNVLDPKYQEKVFVHLERAHRSRFAQRGTELWTYIGAGSSYVLPHTDQVLYVCSVGPELATVMVARTDREARNACTSDPATTTSTQKPVKRIQWKLARSRQSCTDSCREDGKVCDDMALQETNTNEDILKAGELANRTCQANPQHNYPATVGWGYDWNPAICTHRRCCGCGQCRGICAFGDTGRRSCDQRASGHYQRLCPCADRSAITM